MGKLIVFEGTDGSGKSTQFRLLTERLQREGQAFHRLVFPRYSEESSALIRQYLRGDFGSSPDDVNAYAASVFYAVDRYASWKSDWEQAYRAGTPILTDRYTTSNAVHQGSKEPPERRTEFFTWLQDLEYEKLGLPKPDLVLWLDMPTQQAVQLLRSREQVTGTRADIHERDLAYLARCHQAGTEAAAHYGWTVIPCTRDGQLRPAEQIHTEIYALVRAVLSSPPAAV